MLTLIQLLMGVSAQDGQTYRAGVIEFAPALAANMSLSLEQAMTHKLMNLGSVESYVARAKASGCQIVVLPEYGITGDGVLAEGGTEKFTRDGVVPFTEEIADVGIKMCHGSTSSVSLTSTQRKIGVHLSELSPC